MGYDVRGGLGRTNGGGTLLAPVVAGSDGSGGPFKNVFTIGVKFVPNVGIGSTNTSVDSRFFCIFKGFGSHFNIFFYYPAIFGVSRGYIKYSDI